LEQYSFGNDGAYFVAEKDKPLPLELMQLILSKSCVTAIDCADTNIPVASLSQMTKKYYMRLNALNYPSVTEEVCHGFNNLFKKCENVLLVACLELKDIIPMLAQPRDTLKHVHITLSSEAELITLFQGTPLLKSLVVLFSSKNPYYPSLKTFHDTAPDSLKFLRIETGVTNPPEDQLLQIKFIVSLLAFEPIAPFDTTFFGNTRNELEEVAIAGDSLQIPFDHLISCLQTFTHCLEKLQVTGTNLTSDQLLSVLEDGPKLRELRADWIKPSNDAEEPAENQQALMGFSNGALRRYLLHEASSRLEVLTVRGHSRLTHDIVAINFRCMQSLKVLDVRDTGCTSDTDLEVLATYKNESFGNNPAPAGHRYRIKSFSGTEITKKEPEVLKLYINKPLDESLTPVERPPSCPAASAECSEYDSCSPKSDSPPPKRRRASVDDDPHDADPLGTFLAGAGEPAFSTKYGDYLEVIMQWVNDV
jgi:hypothetical protein